MPAGRALRNAGTAVPRAVERSTKALDEATVARTEVGTVRDSLGQARETIDGLTAFKEDITGWQQTTDGALKNLLEITGEDGPLGRAGERLAFLEARVNSAERLADRAGERIDQVLTARAAGLPGDVIDRNVRFNEELLTFLDSVRTGVVRGVEGTPQEERVRNALAAGEESLTLLRNRVRAGSFVLTDEAETLANVVDSMVAAVKEAGAPAGAMRDLRATARALRETIIR